MTFESLAVGYGYPINSTNYSTLFLNCSETGNDSLIRVPSSNDADSLNQEQMRERFGVFYGNALARAMNFSDEQRNGQRVLTIGVGYQHSEKMGLYAAGIVIPRPDVRRGLYYSFTAVERANTTPEVYERLSSGEILDADGLDTAVCDLFGGRDFLVRQMPGARGYIEAKSFEKAVDLNHPFPA